AAVPTAAGGYADEGAPGRSRLDAVLPVVPRGTEHDRDLLEVVQEKSRGVFAEVGAALARPEGFGAEQLLEFLRERRLRDAAAPDAEQLDLAIERRFLALTERANDVVRGGEVVVPIQLASRQRDEVRRI